MQKVQLFFADSYNLTIFINAASFDLLIPFKGGPTWYSPSFIVPIQRRMLQ
jgi:hypothetical protein